MAVQVQPKAHIELERNIPPMTKIILEENDNIPPTGLFIGVNGKGWILRAGEEVTVPDSVREVLDQAVMSIPQMDNTTKQIVGWRDRLRFPYRVVR